MSAPPPPHRGPARPALALGVLALVIALVLVVGVLAPALGVLVAPVFMLLRVLGLLVGAAAVAVGVVVLRAARRGAGGRGAGGRGAGGRGAGGRGVGGRGAGAAAVALGVVGVLGVVVAVPVILRSQAQDFQEGQAAAADAGPDRPAEEDVRIDRCVPSPSGHAAHLSITNSTDHATRYTVYVEVLDASGTSRGLLLMTGQPAVEPGQTVQAVAEGSVIPGVAGSCRVVSADRG